ncbi:MAG: 50S ribosomal protein L25/general stress protein Ctc, partial [Thiotrichales bacterium]|nr:50S ribosomal protein L25/general stress protein Ctc [Thiotrichales bacterium]
YGHGVEARAITLGHDEVFHQLELEAFYSHILTLKLDDDSIKVVLKDLQRHPHKPHIMHIDLQQIDESEKLTMRVPIHLVNEDKCVGVKTGGGMVNQIMYDIEIVCLPRDLPEYIDIDLLELEVGSSIQLRDLKTPEGVELYAALHGEDMDTPVVSIVIPKAVEEEVELEAEGEEAAVAPSEVPTTAEETEEEKPED